MLQSRTKLLEKVFPIMSTFLSNKTISKTTTLWKEIPFPQFNVASSPTNARGSGFLLNTQQHCFQGKGEREEPVQLRYFLNIFVQDCSNQPFLNLEPACIIIIANPGCQAVLKILFLLTGKASLLLFTVFTFCDNFGLQRHNKWLPRFAKKFRRNQQVNFSVNNKRVTTFIV